MSPSPRLEESSPLVSPDLSPLISFPGLVKSWFVRFYDHLITLVGLNALWCLASGGLTYGLIHFKVVLNDSAWRPLALIPLLL